MQDQGKHSERADGAKRCVGSIPTDKIKDKEDFSVELLDMSGQTGSAKIKIGTTKDGEQFTILGESIDGNLSIITGKRNRASLTSRRFL